MSDGAVAGTTVVRRDEAARPLGDGRAECFRVLFEAEYRAILAYALRRCESSDDANDVVAEVFGVAWRRFDELPPRDEVRPWLFGVARRCLSTQRRGRLRRARLAERLGALDVPSDGRVAETSEDERVAILRSALARLRLADREILQLAAWEELSHRQIAVALGISENAVAIRLHRARTRLRRAMDEVSDRT